MKVKYKNIKISPFKENYVMTMQVQKLYSKQVYKKYAN